MWAIDEYAMILRSCVWFSPPQPPTITESKDIVRSRFRLMLGKMEYKMDKGASFCQVRRIRPDDRGMPCVTSGTQKWKGDRPSFMVIARVRMMDAVGLMMFVTVH